ncbi:unnamed protein product [Clonostachys rosea]|uniref:Uncharacterized protein n=1 Tax=Bionectria ochroleuca TaxID=29856 RepID=A0ABY6TXN4_BIOOC|nr:unnamed protein product [Clonostachys rosea]
MGSEWLEAVVSAPEPPEGLNLLQAAVSANQQNAATAPTSEIPLSSRIDSLQASIWTDLTISSRQQCINELDRAWCGRGWIPPWPQADITGPGAVCTADTLPSTDILNLATITRLCSHHHITLLALWEPGGIIYEIARRATSGLSLVWSQELCAQAVVEAYHRYGSIPSHKRRRPLEAQEALHDSCGDTSSKRRGTSLRSSRSSSSSPILTREGGSPRQASTIDEALEEAKHLQRKLQSFQLTLREHLEKFPRGHQEIMKAESEYMQHELQKAQAECDLADQEVKSCEEEYQSLQRGSHAATSRYSILKEWLEPVLLVNQTQIQAETSSSVLPDPGLQDAMKAVSVMAQKALEKYGGEISSERTIACVSDVLDRARAASTRQSESRMALKETQKKVDQIKIRLELETQRVVIEKILHGAINMLDANRPGRDANQGAETGLGQIPRDMSEDGMQAT